MTTYKVFTPNEKIIKIPETAPQTPTIVQVNSLNEILALRGSLVLAHSTNAGAGVNATLYTVPQDYVFFLIGASISSSFNAPWAGGDVSWYAELRSRPSGTPTAILSQRINALQNVLPLPVSNSSLSPVIPLVFIAGSIFYVYQQSSLITTEACIQGYLIKSTEIPQFLS